MSRPITDLFPEVRLNASGVPEPLALLSLSSAYSDFLDRSEAWKEWGAAFAFSTAATGLKGWQNHTGATDQRWVRIKRIDMILARVCTLLQLALAACLVRDG